MGGAMLASEGLRIVGLARERGLVVRLLGGVAIYARSTAPSRQAFARPYADLDIVAHGKESRLVRDLLEEQGYVPEQLFNAANGARRLLYQAPDDRYHIDVFLDRFEMSHNLDFASRMEVEDKTLPAAELLLTKFQVAHINRKDLTDAAQLLADHVPSRQDGAGQLNVAQIAIICADDWGFYTTLTDNLAHLRTLLPELQAVTPPARTLISERLAQVESAVAEASKTRRWRIRARVGRRIRWYETPEEVER